jgi:branched-chain amino acid transport system ATP-binding protein
MFEARAVTARYTNVDVLTDVTVAVSPGQIVALVGANGAGKSTLLNVLAGTMQPRRGSVLLDDQRARGRWSAAAAVRYGVALVPEGRHVFADLSVSDNLLLGAWVQRRNHGVLSSQFDMVFGLVPMLAERKSTYAGLLSGGQQQMLAIARGLMSQPRYLLLDEPSLGLAPIIVAEIFASIGELARAGVGILLAEQNGRAALDLAEYGYVLERGRTTLHGTGSELLNHPEIEDRFLGTGGHGAPIVTGLRDRVADALRI